MEKLQSYIALLMLFFFNNILSAQDNTEMIIQLDSDSERQITIDRELLFENSNIAFVPIKQLSKSLNIWLFGLKEGDENRKRKSFWKKKQLLVDVTNSPEVKAVQYNDTLSFRTIPNDNLFAKQWQYQNNGYKKGVVDADIDAPEAWEITTGGNTIAGDEIVVTIIDGGVDVRHPDLRDNLWINQYEIPDNGIDDDRNGYKDDIYGWNFNHHHNDVSDHNVGIGHGSAVSGIIGARGNNGIGVSGINWNVKIMNLVANTNIADIILAYDYILEMRKKYNSSKGKEGAFIVATNTSLGINNGSPKDAPLWCAMYDALGEAGIISVASTANRNINVDLDGDLPTTCNSEYLISVTNTTVHDTKEKHAGYGAQNIDMGAPGSNTFTVTNNGNYDFFGGTSAAAPHVTGTVGLLYSATIPEFVQEVRQQPEKAALIIKKSILKGVDVIPSLQKKSVTGGRLNLYKSLIELYDHYNIDPIKKEDNVSTKTFLLYPNPAHNEVYIDLELIVSGTIDIQIFNTIGQLVKQQESEPLDIGFHQIATSLEGIKKGIYFVKINNSVISKILIK